MKINIKSTNYDAKPAVRDLIGSKFSALEKYYNNIQQVDVEVGLTTRGQQKGDIYFCEANVSVPGKLLRYRTEASDLTKAIGEVKKGIQNEIKKFKEKNS